MTQANNKYIEEKRSQNRTVQYITNCLKQQALSTGKANPRLSVGQGTAQPAKASMSESKRA
jgi:hypothetical protein